MVKLHVIDQMKTKLWSIGDNVRAIALAAGNPP